MLDGCVLLKACAFCQGAGRNSGWKPSLPGSASGISKWWSRIVTTLTESSAGFWARNAAHRRSAQRSKTHTL